MQSSFAISSDVSLKSFQISKCDVTLGFKEFLNIALSIFVVSTIQIYCNELAFFALGSVLEKLED